MSIPATDITKTISTLKSGLPLLGNKISNETMKQLFLRMQAGQLEFVNSTGKSFTPNDLISLIQNLQNNHKTEVGNLITFLSNQENLSLLKNSYQPGTVPPRLNLDKVLANKPIRECVEDGTKIQSNETKPKLQQPTSNLITYAGNAPQRHNIEQLTNAKPNGITKGTLEMDFASSPLDDEAIKFLLGKIKDPKTGKPYLPGGVV